MQYLLIAALLVALVWFVSAPVRAAGSGASAPADPLARVTDLRLRKESKYREIRDARLDHAAGKLSDTDFARVDADLRREALAILEELDRAEAEERRARV